jgi:uncharacterized protein YecE (DUF72 family)
VPDEVSPNSPEQSADVPFEGERNESAGAAMTVVGCADLPPGLRRKRFFEVLDYLENEGTRFRLPAARVLQRWRDEAGPRGRLGLVAPQVITDKPGTRGYARGGEELTAKELAQAGAFGATPVVERAVKTLIEACSALPADTVIFRSPPDFAPSAANRDAMRRFFAELAPAERFGDTVRVWEPQGLWEPEVAARLAGELGLVYAWDPLSNDPLATNLEADQLPEASGYFRITGLGVGKPRFDDYSLEPVLELASECERAWIVFAHAHKYPDAIRCRRLIDTHAP